MVPAAYFPFYSLPSVPQTSLHLHPRVFVGLANETAGAQK